jgi:hypothetical protein
MPHTWLRFSIPSHSTRIEAVNSFRAAVPTGLGDLDPFETVVCGKKVP